MEFIFDVGGMTCAACSARVEKVVRQLSGVRNADVNLLTGKLYVTVDDENILMQIVSAVEHAGYTVAYRQKKECKQACNDPQHLKMRKRLFASAAFLLVLMYFTMGHMIGLPLPMWYHGFYGALLQLVLTVPILCLNRSYFVKGFQSLCNRAPNMDSLIAVGAGAAILYSIVNLIKIGCHGVVLDLYFESAATILTLITLGKYLEMRAKRKTTNAIEQLMDLTPKTAVVIRNGIELTVALDKVSVGDVVVVRSGGSVPVDGVVISGSGSVDQSALTGESVPVEVFVQGVVSAGTILTEGYLEIQAQRVGADTALSQIIRLVEQASGSKAPIARLADKIAGVFVPVVMAISLGTFLVWIIAGMSFSFSLTSAIAVLVISCPCALGLATPVAIMVATGTGARMGILFKSAQALEQLHNVDTVVFDKTGTLTLGKPTVTDILPSGVSEDDLLNIAATLESKSEHPFAKAIMQKAQSYVLSEAKDFQTLPGKGISAIVEKKRYFAGNDVLMKEIGAQIPDLKLHKRSGNTPLYFATEDGMYLGAIIVCDVLKPDAKDAVCALYNASMNVVMLTGDNEETASAIAQAAGIKQVIAGVLPTQKASVIRKLQQDGRKVLMVGDGINDAPALVTADVGAAIGTGTDIAMESADVVLMSSNLIAVSYAVALSKATIKNIRQNLFWAFFYNCLAIPIACGVLYPAFGIQLSPMLGAAAMSFSSVFVVTNALRLRFFSQKKVPMEDKTMETVIYVEGMMCMHCKARVESVCKAVEGVAEAVVDLEAKSVTITGNASAASIKKAIADAGYQVIG